MEWILGFIVGLLLTITGMGTVLTVLAGVYLVCVVARSIIGDKLAASRKDRTFAKKQDFRSFMGMGH